MKLKSIALILLISIMVTSGFSSDSTQGEELLFFLPEVQLARSLDIFLDFPSGDEREMLFEAIALSEMEIDDIPTLTWINNLGGLRPPEDVLILLNKVQFLIVELMVCVDGMGNTIEAFGEDTPFESVIKGNEFEHCDNSFDGRKGPVRFISIFILLNTYLEDVRKVVETLNSSRKPNLELLKREICQSLFERISLGLTLEFRFLSFFALSNLKDRIERLENGLNTSSFENEQCFNLKIGTIQELEIQANNGNIMAAVALQGLLRQQATDSRNDPVARAELQSQINGMMLRSSAGANQW